MNDLPTIKELKEYLDYLKTKNKNLRPVWWSRIPVGEEGLENYIEYRIRIERKLREIKLKRITK